MKHASSRELFAYWTARRGTRPAPERSEIEPAAIRRALGDVFILAFDRATGHPFRLAGTRVCALFGRELRGRPFLEVWEADSRAALAELVNGVSEETTGAVASVSARTAEGWAQALELVLLPLRQRAEAQARVIGVLAPFSVPFWLGAARLEGLTLGTVRHLNPVLEAPAAARLVAGAEAVNGHHGIFVVHEGGRR
jgi:hypothetical protein